MYPDGTSRNHLLPATQHRPHIQSQCLHALRWGQGHGLASLVPNCGCSSHGHLPTIELRLPAQPMLPSNSKHTQWTVSSLRSLSPLQQTPSVVVQVGQTPSAQLQGWPSDRAGQLAHNLL